MARVPITAVEIPSASLNGYNLTDSSDFTTMATGADNGVEIPFSASTIIILKNASGVAADYTLKIPEPTGVADAGGGVTDSTISVADGKTHIIKPTSVMKQADGKIYIDCDQAADILVLNT